MIKYLLYREKTEPNWKRSNAFYDKNIIPKVLTHKHTHIDTYILVYVYCKWATDVLSRVYAEYIIDRVRELRRMSGVLKSVKVTVPKLITVTIVCWANTTATVLEQ